MIFIELVVLNPADLASVLEEHQIRRSVELPNIAQFLGIGG
jgi:hypothetical protein